MTVTAPGQETDDIQIVAMPQPWVIRRFNDTAHLDDAFTITPAPLT